MDHFKSRVVWLILDGAPEEALKLLAENYQVAIPDLKVGMPKKHKFKAWGCYTAKNQTIYVCNSDVLVNPLVILHEFYHHLRSRAVDRVHRGTENKADQFAMDFVLQYQAAIKETQQKDQ
ncbi:MAG: hypothetical protein LBH74_09610 [Nitrososphaerota archaeon]|uniref:hypothetical protein n=1 Tax=Candidatus Bathycorpusculum sp. TaxID=2994959 RepID=UPI0028285CBB|nr:hypothetical protein [Candidatus Termitimicrobium sp.]MCL2431951.1 hypothetical protein [Candidatus Termitimicrobium sp.]MDR0493874.1 hypothetical protein [Nitrososphaerota archaeon]